MLSFVAEKVHYLFANLQIIGLYKADVCFLSLAPVYGSIGHPLSFENLS